MAKTKLPNALPFSVELAMIELGSIVGQDDDTQDFLATQGFVPDLTIEYAAWNPETLNFLYLSAPMVLIARADGYNYLGSGRAYALAQELYAPTDKVPALLIGAKRINRQTKLQYLAGELFGLHSAYRTRRHLPTRLYAIWNQLLAEAVPVIPGTAG
jgi:hypothetical protein